MRIFPCVIRYLMIVTLGIFVSCVPRSSSAAPSSQAVMPALPPDLTQPLGDANCTNPYSPTSNDSWVVKSSFENSGHIAYSQVSVKYLRFGYLVTEYSSYSNIKEHAIDVYTLYSCHSDEHINQVKYSQYFYSLLTNKRTLELEINSIDNIVIPNPNSINGYCSWGGIGGGTIVYQGQVPSNDLGSIAFHDAAPRARKYLIDNKEIFQIENISEYQGKLIGVVNYYLRGVGLIKTYSIYHSNIQGVYERNDISFKLLDNLEIYGKRASVADFASGLSAVPLVKPKELSSVQELISSRPDKYSNEIICVNDR